jgi:hypothetical protein
MLASVCCTASFAWYSLLPFPSFLSSEENYGKSPALSTDHVTGIRSIDYLTVVNDQVAHLHARLALVHDRRDCTGDGLSKPEDLRRSVRATTLPMGV